MGPVGRKSRRAQVLPSLAVNSAPDLSRAVRVQSTENDPEPYVCVCISGQALDQATSTARLKSGADNLRDVAYPRRAEIFAPPRQGLHAS
jgi:hypothetical protein